MPSYKRHGHCQSGLNTRFRRVRYVGHQLACDVAQSVVQHGRQYDSFCGILQPSVHRTPHDCSQVKRPECRRPHAQPSLIGARDEKQGKMPRGPEDPDD